MNMQLGHGCLMGYEFEIMPFADGTSPVAPPV
jgi:hypothetical protein